jgi:hypothetical protein
MVYTMFNCTCWSLHCEKKPSKCYLYIFTVYCTCENAVFLALITAKYSGVSRVRLVGFLQNNKQRIIKNIYITYVLSGWLPCLKYVWQNAIIHKITSSKHNYPMLEILYGGLWLLPSKLLISSYFWAKTFFFSEFSQDHPIIFFGIEICVLEA